MCGINTAQTIMDCLPEVIQHNVRQYLFATYSKPNTNCKMRKITKWYKYIAYAASGQLLVATSVDVVAVYYKVTSVYFLV